LVIEEKKREKGFSLYMKRVVGRGDDAVLVIGEKGKA